jgi:hypothetical protein
MKLFVDGDDILKLDSEDLTVIYRLTQLRNSKKPPVRTLGKVREKHGGSG